MLLVEVAQDVALILLVIGTANEKVLSVPGENLGVMTRRDRVKTEASRALKQQIELDVSIALDARVGRVSRRVPRNKRRHYVSLKLLGVVKDVVINAEHLSDATGIVNVRDGATARVRHAAP